jgi:hypothetical protein
MITKPDLLVYTARLFVGVKEGPGNGGELIHSWQASTGAINQPWCVSFALYCLDKVDLLFQQTEYGPSLPHGLPRTASVISLWKLAKNKVTDVPKPGCLVAWQIDDSPLGHIGILTEMLPGAMRTVEGNTSACGNIDREGEGVFEKVRAARSQGHMRLLGFIDPWRANA